MNDIQNIIDRHLGIYSRFNYDNVLKRLMVNNEESFYGLQSDPLAAINYDHDPPIFACRFSTAAGYEHILALANEDGRVAIQDTSTVRSVGLLEGFPCHNNAVFDVAWMPRQKSFVTVSGDHTACLWDVSESSPRRVCAYSQHTKSVKTAVFRPTESSVFATGARDGHILIWDIRANNQAAMMVHKADNCLMNCHSNFTPKTPGSHGKRPRIDNHRAMSITGLVFQNDLTLISCGECDGNIKVWDLRKNYNIYTKEPLPKHSIPYCGSSTKNGYTNLITDDAGVRLYASCMDDVIYCFNISTYSSLPERRYVGHENSTFYIKTSLSPDGLYLVSGSSDKNAYIWNVKYSQPVVKLAGHRAEVTCAAWCQKGDIKVVTCSDDARHKIWRIGREFPEVDDGLQGRAEVVPRADVTSLPPWGGLDKTPNSLKRKITNPISYSAKRARESSSAKKTKRCLADLMNASKETDEAETTVKRLKLDMPCIPEEQLPPAGIKRQRHSTETSPDCATPCKIKHLDPDASSKSPEWTYYTPKAGSSFMSPTKCYEKRTCKVLSAKSPKAISSSTIPHRTPVKVSPTKVRALSVTTAIENLPNFALNGEAPHLRLMSPVKKKQDTTDWLTLMVREKKGIPIETVKKVNQIAPLSPREIMPTRRNSVSEKTPSVTLLKYFSVVAKKKA